MNRNEISNSRAFLSVFELMVRRYLPLSLAFSAIFAAISLLAGVAAAKWGSAGTPEMIFSTSRARLTAFAGLILLSLVLCGTFSGKTREEYMLGRLSLGSSGITAARWLAGVVMLLVYWALLSAAALAVCLVSSRLRPADFTTQTIFLGFYRSRYLHGLVPMEDAASLVRSIALVLSLAAVCACSAGKYGRRRVSLTLVVMLGIFWLSFGSELFETAPAILETAAALITAACAVYGCYSYLAEKAEEGGEADEADAA